MSERVKSHQIKEPHLNAKEEFKQKPEHKNNSVATLRHTKPFVILYNFMIREIN